MSVSQMLDEILTSGQSESESSLQNLKLSIKSQKVIENRQTKERVKETPQKTQKPPRIPQKHLPKQASIFKAKRPRRSKANPKNTRKKAEGAQSRATNQMELLTPPPKLAGEVRMGNDSSSKWKQETGGESRSMSKEDSRRRSRSPRSRNYSKENTVRESRLDTPSKVKMMIEKSSPKTRKKKKRGPVTRHKKKSSYIDQYLSRRKLIQKSQYPARVKKRNKQKADSRLMSLYISELKQKSRRKLEDFSQGAQARQSQREPGHSSNSVNFGSVWDQKRAANAKAKRGANHSFYTAGKFGGGRDAEVNCLRIEGESGWGPIGFGGKGRKSVERFWMNHPNISQVSTNITNNNNINIFYNHTLKGNMENLNWGNGLAAIKRFSLEEYDVLPKKRQNKKKKLLSKIKKKLRLTEHVKKAKAKSKTGRLRSNKSLEQVGSTRNAGQLAGGPREGRLKKFKVHSRSLDKLELRETVSFKKGKSGPKKTGKKAKKRLIQANLKNKAKKKKAKLKKKKKEKKNKKKRKVKTPSKKKKKTKAKKAPENLISQMINKQKSLLNGKLTVPPMRPSARKARSYNTQTKSGITLHRAPVLNVKFPMKPDFDSNQSHSFSADLRSSLNSAESPKSDRNFCDHSLFKIRQKVGAEMASEFLECDENELPSLRSHRAQALPARDPQQPPLECDRQAMAQSQEMEISIKDMHPTPTISEGSPIINKEIYREIIFEHTHSDENPASRDPSRTNNPVKIFQMQTTSEENDERSQNGASAKDIRIEVNYRHSSDEDGDGDGEVQPMEFKNTGISVEEILLDREIAALEEVERRQSNPGIKRQIQNKIRESLDGNSL